MAWYYFYVFQKKQKNKRPEVFIDLLVVEIINISLSSVSSKWVNDFAMPASIIYIYIYIYIYIQGVTGGTDQTSGGCSLC